MEEKKDPIKVAFVWCENCEPNIEKLIIYIRRLEDAQVIAKQALESIDTLNKKLNKENETYKLQAEVWEDKAKKTSQKDLEDKMALIDKHHNKIVNREKMFT